MTDSAIPPGKRCTGCGIVKPLDQFWRRKDRPSGVVARCRDCMSHTDRRIRPADPDATEKRCTGCGLVKPLSDFGKRLASFDGLNSRCRDCRYPGYTERQNAPPKDLAADARARTAKHGQKLREAVFAHYGKVCTCCGSTEDLTIDHPDGDGAAHREEVTGAANRAGIPFYRWLIAQGFPPGFQTMCRPCNASKINGPACRLRHSPPA